MLCVNMVISKQVMNMCFMFQALVRERQASEEVGRLQETIAKLLDEAGARTRKEVSIRDCRCSDCLHACQQGYTPARHTPLYILHRPARWPKLL